MTPTTIAPNHQTVSTQEIAMNAHRDNTKTLIANVRESTAKAKKGER